MTCACNTKRGDDAWPKQQHADGVAVVVAPVALVGVALLLGRTRTGMAVRAAADRSDRALSLGIPVRDPAQTRSVAVEALTRLVVTDAQGRRLPGFKLEGVPRAPGWTAPFRKDAP